MHQKRRIEIERWQYGLLNLLGIAYAIGYFSHISFNNQIGIPVSILLPNA